MYKHICLTQALRCNCCPYPNSALPYLVHTLIERPDLARRIKSLEVWMRNRRLVRSIEEPYAFVGNPYFECFKMAFAHIHTIESSFGEKVNWGNELYQYQEVALYAVLITLLPRLQDLKLYAPVAKSRMFSSRDERDRERHVEATPNYSFLDVALRNSPITSMYLGMPFRTTPFSSGTLTTIEVDVTFFMDRIDWEMADTLPTLPLVHSVSIVLNPTILRGVKLKIYCLEPDVRVSLHLFVRDMVISMTNFSITSPRGQVSFDPSEQNCTDQWELVLPSTVEYRNMFHDIGDNPLYNDWGDNTSWDWLFVPLSFRRLKNRLRQLKVPLSWYSSNG
jgi:hypothetical protein